MSQNTLSVVHVPASNDIVLLLGIFLNPCHFNGGGSIPLISWYYKYSGNVLVMPERCVDSFFLICKLNGDPANDNDES